MTALKRPPLLTFNSSPHPLLRAALLIVFLTGGTACAPSPEAPRDTDEPARSVPAAASSTTQTPTPPPRAPTPRPTAARVLPTATPTLDPDLVLPDLQTLPPSDLVIETTANDRKLLKLTNSIMNAGPGALELLGVLNPATNRTAVTQHIDTLEGDFEEHAAGEFIFHPGHDHWHLADFALYEVWSLTADGALDTVVAFADKISYCLRDDSRSGADDAARDPVYTACDQQLQGISVGWIDTYEYDTPGQIVDITNVPNGIYALRSTVDPANRLRETDDTNNAAVIYFELQGNRVRRLERE